jgi:hypothetical protein
MISSLKNALKKIKKNPFRFVLMGIIDLICLVLCLSIFLNYNLQIIDIISPIAQDSQIGLIGIEEEIELSRNFNQNEGLFMIASQQQELSKGLSEAKSLMIKMIFYLFIVFAFFQWINAILLRRYKENFKNNIKKNDDYYRIFKNFLSYFVLSSSFILIFIILLILISYIFLRMVYLIIPTTSSFGSILSIFYFFLVWIILYYYTSLKRNIFFVDSFKSYFSLLIFAPYDFKFLRRYIFYSICWGILFSLFFISFNISFWLSFIYGIFFLIPIWNIRKIVLLNS